jgi:uncharacterized protein YjgD (DUF1641 family)
VEYAAACRYPVILVLVDVKSENAWYIWLQEWILLRRSLESPLREPNSSWDEWVSERQTVQAGLTDELRTIAKWESQSQLVLSLLDALRSAAAVENYEAVRALADIVDKSSTNFGDAPINALIDRAISIGSRLRGSTEGNAVSDQLFSLVRRLGNRVSLRTVAALVVRGHNEYSRTGLVGLGILYDEFPDHLKSLGLPEFFKPLQPHVAYYCAFREAFPGHHDLDSGLQSGFRFAGLEFSPSDRYMDKYMNRGPSAILDYLMPSSSD